jgi:hypothetical protein
VTRDGDGVDFARVPGIGARRATEEYAKGTTLSANEHLPCIDPPTTQCQGKNNLVRRNCPFETRRARVQGLGHSSDA